MFFCFRSSFCVSIRHNAVSHTVQDLVFIWNMTDPLVVNEDIELPQQDISKIFTTDCTIEYSTGNFTCLAVVFNLRRRIGYHLFHTYIPSALIVVMSWISFWIKPEAIPARVTLGVTSLLTLGTSQPQPNAPTYSNGAHYSHLIAATHAHALQQSINSCNFRCFSIWTATQNTQSQQALPPVSYVKAVDVWMSSCSVFVFLSLMEFAVVNNYMGPVATKAMKGFSEENLPQTNRTNSVSSGTVAVDGQKVSHYFLNGKRPSKA